MRIFDRGSFLLLFALTLGCVRPREPVTVPGPFTVTGIRAFYLIGNELTAGDDRLTAHVSTDLAVDAVEATLGDRTFALAVDDEGVFRLDAPIDALGPGEYVIAFRADGSETPFAEITFQRSHPLYVMVSTGWDISDPSDAALNFQDGLHDRHPAALITHFVGPYTFTDPAVADVRRAELVAWLLAQERDHGDEIGLHIHPYCHFVEHAGVVCNTVDSTVYASDDTGYTIKVAAYGEEDFGRLLDAADALFQASGLGKPITFRAGGWTASIETLRALASHGYVADTSANNWARMEEWQGLHNGELYRWNQEHWATIVDTGQPYYPNEGDILSSAAPALSILEVPDNAIMVDYVSVGEMSEILAANWDGGALMRPVAYMMGFHPAGPSSFGADEQARVDGFLDLTDESLAADGTGPVVYARLRDMPIVFPR